MKKNGGLTEKGLGRLSFEDFQTQQDPSLLFGSKPRRC